MPTQNNHTFQGFPHTHPKSKLFACSSLYQEYRYGYILFSPFDIYFAIGLEVYGEWSQKEMELMLSLLRRGDTVVEAGVHIGSMTVGLAQRVGPEGWLHGFEPQRVLHQLACANVALNGLHNVRLLHAAAGTRRVDIPRGGGGGGGEEDEGGLLMTTFGRDELRNYGALRVHEMAGLSGSGAGMEEGKSPDEEGAATERVSMLRIDDLGLRDCSLIKVDVEGLQDHVLEGAAETISRFSPAVYFEEDRGLCTPSVVGLLRRGYHCFRHVAPYFNEDNWMGEKENFFVNGDTPSVAYMVLCLPSHRLPPPPGHALDLIPIACRQLGSL